MGQLRAVDLDGPPTEPDDVHIEFTDGELFCRGFVDLPDGELVAMDGEQSVERSRVVFVRVIESGLLTVDGSTSELQPGSYMLNDSGLFKHIDGCPST